MSSWRIFCVTDFRDRVDNLSSNYSHPPPSYYTDDMGLSQRSVRKDVMWADGKQLKRIHWAF